MYDVCVCVCVGMCLVAATLPARELINRDEIQKGHYTAHAHEGAFTC